MEFKVQKTTLKRQPFPDFVSILTPKGLEELEAQDGGCVILENTIKRKPEKGGEEESIVLRMESPVISSSNGAVDSDNEAGDDKICIDQTYREALAVEPGQTIQVTPSKARIDTAQHILRKINFQKSVVRVQPNASYMERKVPVMCICKEMVESIGAAYGDRIIIESVAGLEGKKIEVRCAPLTFLMQKFHDYVLSSIADDDERNRLKNETKTYFTDPNDWGIRSNVCGNMGDAIHPIFVDFLARRALGDDKPISVLCPVKIRRSFRWELAKKLNYLGSLGVLAIPIILLGLTNDPYNLFYWLLMATFGFWVSWSLMTSSTYRASSSK